MSYDLEFDSLPGTFRDRGHPCIVCHKTSSSDSPGALVSDHQSIGTSDFPAKSTKQTSVGEAVCRKKKFCDPVIKVLRVKMSGV